MRPEKLIISAFGPYAEEVNIDFNMLGDKGVYLISGNTGAGKSTIFDAIRFALYGDENVEVRSKYADDKSQTYVELTFELRSQIYKIKRNPKYIRPKSRGEGYTEAKAEAELICPNGKVVTGYGTVTREVTDILGLNSEQFSKIVMIAQGKFRELLVADTQSRSKIFRDIFKTSSYDLLQRKVKNRFLEVNKEYQKVNDSILQYVKEISVNSCYENSDKLYEIMMQSIVTDVEEVIELLNDLIKYDEIKLSESRDRLKNVQKCISDKEVDLIKLVSLGDMIKQLIKEYERINQYEKLDEEVYGQYAEMNKCIPEKDKLLVDIEKEKQAVKSYNVYDEKRNELVVYKEKETKNKEKYNSLINEKEKLENKLKELDTLQKETEGTEVKIAEVESKIRDNTLKIKAVEKILKLSNIYNSLKGQYEKIAKEYKEKRQAEDIARNIYDGILKSFLDEQAGIMADTLRDNPNMPCPVCGSTTHIKLAEYTGEKVTEEQVRSAKASWDKANNVLVQKSKEAYETKTELDGTKQQLEETIAELGHTWDVEECDCEAKKCLAKALDEGKILDSEKEELEEKIRRKKEITEAIINTKDKLSSIDIDLKSVNDINHQYQLKIKEISTQIDVLKEGLIYENGGEAEKQLLVLEEKYKAIIEKIKNTTERKEKHEKDKATCKAVIGQIEKQVEEIYVEKYNKELHINSNNQLDIINKEVDDTINIYKGQLELNKEESQKYEDINNEIYARITSNTQILSNLRTMHKRLENNITNLTQVKVLSDTLNGEMEGKDKIKLETFVQISYFEQVIAKANTKLFEMTEGQYEFVRDTYGDDKRSKSGLELSVYDHYNGTVRSVKTLSGGESFMASLSLALGMADIIEESASGITIDTMFIDEGFGSLDEVALEQAMKVLSKLSEGNKLVGIISHVGSLRDRIERQINVVKEYTGGSKVIINV